MDINYKILWFEDTDDSFNTLSRRTKTYVEKRNLKCSIERVFGVEEFDMNQYELDTYEIIVVDLKLLHGSRGYDIINMIRQGKCVNDVLFYSSEGVDELNSIMREYRLEGVFVCDRNHKEFMPKIQQLIDKSIRRSENIINIRGIVLDETSEFDTQICEIIDLVQQFISQDEKNSLKEYAHKLFEQKCEDINKLKDKYGKDKEWCISEVIKERDFDSMMKSKLINYLCNNSNNEKIVNAVRNCRHLLERIYENDKIKFTYNYEKDIIVYRNKLAHVKTLNASKPVLIGTINGTKCYCDSEFCSSMRATLIEYKNWFNALYNSIQF